MIMFRQGSRPLAILIAGMLIPSALHAQSAPAPAHSSDAGAHFDRGTTFYGEGDYAAALVEFKRAYELDPAWQVLFNVGQSYFQLRDYANALVTLRRFASEGGDRLSREDRATIDSELPDLVNRVGRVTVASNVDGASVLVDDQAVGKTPLREPVLVSAGMRKITAVMEHRAPVERSVAVGGGDNLTLRLDFATPLDEAPPTGAEPRPTPRTAETPSHLPAFVTFALAGAGIATGAVFGVLTMQDKSRLDHACDSSRTCPPSAQPDIDAMGRDGLVSSIGFGAGAALLALGVGLWLLERPGSPATEATASSSSMREPVRLTVRVGAGALAGTF
jgi:hypothetical protein